MRGVFLATVLCAGFFLGVCRILYEQASDDLDNRRRFADDELIAKNDERLDYPSKAAVFFVLSILLMIVAAGVLITAAFWRSTSECTLKAAVDGKSIVCER